VKIAEAFVEIRPDTTGFASGVQREAASAANRAKGAFKNLLAGAAIGLFAKGSFDEIQEAEKSAKQLEQTIRSTGSAAHVTAGHATELADAISKASAVDDELVANAERMLLTFTNIKNSGADKVFDRATQAAVDLGVAMGGDLQGAALQLGKALQDPEKGLTRLMRVGVDFTESEKNQIKVLTEHGQTAKAQGIILGEVEKQFGGQAAAAATDADRAKVAFQNLEESVGRAFLPVMNDAAKAATVLANAFSAQPAVLQQVEIGVLAAGFAYAKLGGPIKSAVTSLKEFKAANSALSSGAAGAAGPVAIAAGLTLMATAGLKLIDAFAAGRLQHVKGDIDQVTLSLQRLAKGGSGGIDVSGLNSDLDTLESTAGRVARNPIFSGTPFHGAASSAFKAAKDDVDGLDKSLAATVEAGHADKAKEQLQALAAAGLDVGRLKPFLDDYNDALAHNAVEAGNAAGASDKLKASTDPLAAVADAAGRKFQSLNDEIDKYLGKVLGTDEAVGNFQKSINDEGQAVKDAAGHFNDATNQSIDFNTAQRDIVTNAAGVLQAMRDSGATASEVRDRQKDLATQYYLTAIANGVPKAVAEKYAAAILSIPTSRKTVLQVFLDDAEAIRKLNELGNRINNLGGGRHGGFDVAAFVAANTRASGGPVTAGHAYIVGENNPELFVPSQNGTILPNVGGGGMTVIVTGVIGDQEAVGRHLVNILNDHQKRYGR
jgi:hypothetical protein